MGKHPRGQGELVEVFHNQPKEEAQDTRSKAARAAQTEIGERGWCRFHVLLYFAFSTEEL